MKFLFSLFGTMMLFSPICTYGQTTKVGDINGDGMVTISIYWHCRIPLYSSKGHVYY